MLNMSNLINSLITLSDNVFIGASFFTDPWGAIKQGFFTIALGIVQVFLNLVKNLLDVIFDLVQIDLFSGEAIGEITRRVYLILGVVVLFKVIISCIQYLINPDKTNDKESGFGNIFKRVIITLALLALVGPIFDFAKTAQLAICDAIPKVILGSEGEDRYSVEENMVYSTLLTFFEEKTGNMATFKQKYPTFDKVFDNANEIYEKGEFGFAWLLGIAVSGFLVFITASMALDVAIRFLKFGFLELIAPVPIASYVDPKSSKKMFSSWVKTTVSVYLDLFIRLFSIYLIVYLFQTLYDSHLFDQEFVVNGKGVGAGRTWTIRVFVIIGLLMFAKDFPKFMSDALGLKEAGNIAEMFKRRPGGLAIPGASIGAYRNARQYGEGRGTALRRAMTAGTHAGLARAGALLGGKSLAESYGVAKDKANKRTNRNLEYANRYKGWLERTKAKNQERFDNYTGVIGGGVRTQNAVSAGNAAIDARNAMKKRADEKVVTDYGNDYRGVTIDVNLSSGTESLNASQIKTRMEALKMRDDFATNIDLQNDYTTLNNVHQSAIDAQSLAYAADSFAYFGVAGARHDDGTTVRTDGKLRNEAIENIYKIMRSGASPDDVNKLLTFECNGTTYNMAALVDNLSKGENLAPDVARAFVEHYIGKLHTLGGNIRRDATQHQTTVPKGDK